MPYTRIGAYWFFATRHHIIPNPIIFINDFEYSGPDIPRDMMD